jgi:hypothetical protein
MLIAIIFGIIALLLLGFGLFYYINHKSTLSTAATTNGQIYSEYVGPLGCSPTTINSGIWCVTCPTGYDIYTPNTQDNKGCSKAGNPADKVAHSKLDFMKYCAPGTSIATGRNGIGCYKDCPQNYIRDMGTDLCKYINVPSTSSSSTPTTTTSAPTSAPASAPASAPTGA